MAKKKEKKRNVKKTMVKGFNLEVNDFKEGVVQLIKISNLPITMIAYAMDGLTREVNQLAAKAVQSERAEFERKLKEKEEGEKRNGAKGV